MTTPTQPVAIARLGSLYYECSHCNTGFLQVEGTGCDATIVAFYAPERYNYVKTAKLIFEGAKQVSSETWFHHQEIHQLIRSATALLSATADDHLQKGILELAIELKSDFETEHLLGAESPTNNEEQ